MILHYECKINDMNNKFNQTIVKFVDVFESKLQNLFKIFHKSIAQFFHQWKQIQWYLCSLMFARCVRIYRKLMYIKWLMNCL